MKRVIAPARPADARSNHGASRVRRGTATVEAAIVLSFVFVPLLLGFFEFSRVMQAGQVVTTAARYGVRSAILDGSTEAVVRLQVQEFTSSTLGLSESDVTVTFQVDPHPGNPAVATIDAAEAKDLITVSVSVNYDDVSVVNGKFMGGQPITASAAMRHE